MAQVYVFKSAFKHRKTLWRRIEIRDDQTLGDLDSIMRDAFKHDDSDHLSEFYPDQSCRNGFGEIDPDGGGSGADIKLRKIGVCEGTKLGYVYDFGDYIEHILAFEGVKNVEENVKYPRITDKSKTKNHYCDSCKEKGKKSVATYVCVDCSDDAEKTVYVCEECAEKEHEDHQIEDILF
ncbi:MAG: hypothetical protein CVT88_01200 [Candidatus Altiarchaeales archaeon HGW-Altiarchaeales-1]|nr:MAG: hypothetical protein CVT88_01200 [Candidatus Altiarchaeales archaeon HGW-Altiarchaeales-1]